VEIDSFYNDRLVDGDDSREDGKFAMAIEVTRARTTVHYSSDISDIHVFNIIPASLFRSVGVVPARWEHGQHHHLHSESEGLNSFPPPRRPNY
jgi:hypothetical protein